MADKLKTFENIFLDKLPGILKLNAAGLGWKGREGKDGSKVVTAHGNDIRRAEWFRVMRGYRLQLFHKNNSVMRFEGFREIDFEGLKDFISTNYHITVDEVELGVKGWNWGKAEVLTSSLTFLIGDKQTFEIPLSAVVNATMPTKNEVSLEFASEEPARGVEISEMKFFLPNVEKEAGKEPKEGEEEGEEVAEEGEEKEPSLTAAEKFLKAVKSNADIGKVVGDTIASFSDLPCIHPRGRFELELYPTLLRLHGKTHDYQLKYDGITHLFQLEKSDERHIIFVIGLDPPIRQGQTRYPFLVFQFPKDSEEEEFKVNITEEEADTKYKGKIKTVYQDTPKYKIVSDMFVALADKKLVKTGGSYANRNGSYDLKCSLKASEGFIYPLEKSFLFIPKPTTNIRYSDISSIDFMRVGKAATVSRMFDMKIDTGSGSYTFSNIPREEFENLYEFLKSKNLPIPDQIDEGGDELGEAGGSDSESEEEEEERPKQQKLTGGDNDEDSESEDLDFQPGEESDVEEEYDEDAGADSDGHFSSDEERAGAKAPKTKAPKEEKAPKRKRKESDEEEEGDDEEEGDTKKSKPKGKAAKGDQKPAKKKKDPNAPKGPTSAFLYYSNENRARLKEKGFSFGEIGKQLGVEWKTVSAEEKKRFEEMADQDKERYNREMANYVPPKESPSSKPAAKKQKTSSKPSSSSSSSSASKPSSSKVVTERSMPDEIEDE